MNYSKGLEGVVAGETAISQVEGGIGRLSYRGHDIRKLVHREFEEVAWLVLFGSFPDEHQVALLRDCFAGAQLSAAELQVINALPLDLHPMQVLQGIIPLLSVVPVEGLPDPAEELAAGLPLVAKFPEVLVHYRAHQMGRGQPVAEGETALGGFLARFTDADPDPEQLAVLNVLQILQMEHSFNASTFTARVVASTLAPVPAVLSAAVGALAGSLHGGADEAAMREAIRVGSPERAEAYITDLFARKGKLMGMGHREYRTVDPRSVILKPMARRLCEGTGQANLFATLEALETAFASRMQARGKEVWANLEFYKGPTLQAIGIPSEYFTAVFALARSIGWLAHLAESRQDNRIIRPKAQYVGAEVA